MSNVQDFYNLLSLDQSLSNSLGIELQRKVAVFLAFSGTTPPHRLIATREELSALPDGTVVHGGETIHEMYAGVWFLPGFETPSQPPLPVRVIYSP